MMYEPKQARYTVRVVLAVLLLAGTALAQIQAGENTTLNLDGTFGFGYSGGFEQTGVSSHGMSIVGNGNLTGSYYNRNFLSFSVQPFFNRSQSNGVSQSVFNESGANANVNFFSGSHFPGSVTFTRSINSLGNFGLPGGTGLTTDGSQQGFGINWGVLLPDLPTLQISYTTNSSKSSLLGDPSSFTSRWKNINLYSTYILSGFQLTGNFNHQNMSMDFPATLGVANSGGASANSFGLSAVHKLPLSGSFGASWSHSSNSSEMSSASNNSTTNTVNVGATIMPARKLAISSNANYTGNLLGSYLQSLGPTAQSSYINADPGSKSLAVNTYVTYTLWRGLGLQGHVSQTWQHYAGQDVSRTQYGANVNFNFAKPLFGMLYISVGMVNTANQDGNQGFGAVGNAGLQRRFGHWETSADVSYSQDVQSTIVLYTTSSYGYGGSIRRKFADDTYWSVTYRGFRSGLTQQPDTSNASDSFSSGITWRRYSVQGAYSTSHGNTVLAYDGTLKPVPGPVAVLKDLIYYNAKSYSVGIGYSPVRRMTVTGFYSNVMSDTSSNAVYSQNRGYTYDGRLEYRLRKLNVQGGFRRTSQTISLAGSPNRLVNAYYFNISRWFNVF